MSNPNEDTPTHVQFLKMIAEQHDAKIKAVFGEQEKLVKEVLNDLDKAAFEAYQHKVKLQKPVFEKRSEITKKIPSFWLVAMTKSELGHVIEPEDREALTYLSDLTISHHADPREFDLIFTFTPDNPYFTPSQITKTYLLRPHGPVDAGDEITPAPYDLDATLYSGPATPAIVWKEGKNLLEKSPRVEIKNMEEFDEEFAGKTGSFFHYFAEPEDEGMADLFLELRARALEHYAGLELDEDDDEEGEDSDEEDDDEDDVNKEIDLDAEEESRRRKKQRTH